MKASWPSELPLPRVEYAASPFYPVVVSDRAEPIVRARRRFDAVEHVLDVEWKFSAAELALFAEFYRDALDNGARVFTIALAYQPDGLNREWAVRLDDEVITEYDGPKTATVRARLRLVHEV